LKQAEARWDLEKMAQRSKKLEITEEDEVGTTSSSPCPQPAHFPQYILDEEEIEENEDDTTTCSPRPEPVNSPRLQPGDLPQHILRHFRRFLINQDEDEDEEEDAESEEDGEGDKESEVDEEEQETILAEMIWNMYESARNGKEGGDQTGAKNQGTK
jgi:hypothetical protein